MYNRVINNREEWIVKNSLTENDLKCGMIAYEVDELSLTTILFVSNVYLDKDMNSKCIDYKSFYKDGDYKVLSDYVEHGFLNDHNIGSSYNKNYWFSDYKSAKEYFDSIYNKKGNTQLFMFNFSF